jgi:hypothetical protein
MHPAALDSKEHIGRILAGVPPWSCRCDGQAWGAVGLTTTDEARITDTRPGPSRVQLVQAAILGICSA